MTGRRSFLTKVATTGLGTAAAIAVLPAPPESAATVRSAPDGTDPSPAPDLPWTGTTIADEDATPIARYQYQPASRRGDSYEPTAPVNVVFPLADYPERLPTILAVLEEAGWTTELEEYTRYAWDREAGEYVRQQASAAETYFGANGRLHVRCWEFEGVVSMQAHEDSSVRPKHIIASYVRGRRAVESLFREAGWTVSRTAIDLENGKGPDHDGFASIVVPGPDEADGATKATGAATEGST